MYFNVCTLVVIPHVLVLFLNAQDVDWNFVLTGFS